MSEWLKLDAERIWHPYTQHGLNREILAVRSGQGTWLELEDGRRVIDGISSWWVNIHGHAHPVIAQAIAEQARVLEHVIFAGFSHRPAAELAEILIQAARGAGARSSRVFYSDNGSTAVEVALKMAYQYQLNRGENRRTRFAALKGSYHGDTLAAMSASDPDGFHATFRKLMPEVDFIEPGDPGSLKRLFAKRPGEHAALIIEPLVQGASGMRMHSKEFLQECAADCRDAGALLICDEVFTGFFRTGSLFAFEQAAIAPDLICLSKGITGGFLPLAVTLATDEVFQAFTGTEVRRAFLHGHSYTANPIACAAALASWNLLVSSETQARLRRICELTRERISQIGKIRGAANARALGTIGAVDLAASGSESYFASRSRDLSQEALARGVLLRPLGDVLYTVPPYCVTDSELARIYDVIEELLQ